MSKLLIQEKYTDNGQVSHYELINTETGVVLWDGNEEKSYYNKDKFIQDFAQHMMNLSNRLNELDDEDDYRDDFDIKEDYLPQIRKFISATTGL